MGRGQSDSKIASVTVTLLTVSFTYIVLNLPIGVFSVFGALEKLMDNAHQMAQQYLWLIVGLLLQFTNNSINFVLYCATGPRFRNELKAMFCRQNMK